MKKLKYLILVLLLIMPMSKPMADDKVENNSIYNYIMDNGTSLGKDNLGDNSDTKILPQMSNGANKTINNIVILIRFKGEDEFINKENINKLKDTFNLYKDLNSDNVADSGSISLNSYISDLTYGKVKVNSSFYPFENNNYFSIEAPETREYYENNIAGSREETNFIKWAFDSVKDKINLTANELDQNNDGEIDIVTFLCSGATIKDSMLWPHETRFVGDSSVNGKKISTYNLINIGNDENNLFNKGNLKIVIHEFLHGFSYPDLYRYYRSGNPVGEWDVMASTDGYGQLPLVYTRNFYTNLNLNIQEVNNDGVYKIKSSKSTNKNDIIALKIKSPLSDKEYFMVEFRKSEGNWDSILPGSGLIVYRINNNVNEFYGNRNGSPDHVYVFRQGDINNTYAQGNTRTAFLSKESGRTSIGSNNLNSGFISNSLFFSNGDNSGIVISDIGSANGDEISFKVTYPKINEPVNFSQVVGSDRYSTAAKLSSLNFNLSNTVVIVNGTAIADGLTVTPLATYLNSPILLVEKNYIPKDTINEIKRLGAKKVIIAGGEGVVSKSVELELKKIGIGNIIRLAGNDRYETSLEIAKYIDSNCYDIENIVLANGYAEADAMSIAPISGRDRMAIILSESQNINSKVYNWLKNENLNNAYIVGGNGVIEDKLVDKLNLITSLDISKNRLGGKDRFETNALVIKKFYGSEIENVYASKGYEIIDALSAAPIAALNNGAIVLCDYDLNSAQKNILTLKTTNSIIQVGGGISSTAINSLKAALK
ncbi:cell wall-binding repeat-containing protein [Clostridium sp.]|uniref:cell wall-binding repeat-containing protein n=1 Tax=Clostridium sp. TaxID=1506 RepID=UPI002912E7DF|nr:cell wall-binding repeat-containing protein [Clostridium sp.]MDU5107876.1 cell wall-binding repeat-containing protein [Clostridium sp.]